MKFYQIRKYFKISDKVTNYKNSCFLTPYEENVTLPHQISLSECTFTNIFTEHIHCQVKGIGPYYHECHLSRKSNSSPLPFSFQFHSVNAHSLIYSLNTFTLSKVSKIQTVKRSIRKLAHSLIYSLNTFTLSKVSKIQTVKRSIRKLDTIMLMSVNQEEDFLKR